MTSIPDKLSRPEALVAIREIGRDATRIVLLPHARERADERGVVTRQIVDCVRLGVIEEGPFLNARGNWQVTLRRRSAADQLACVVAIDWRTHLLVVTVY
jgi:hypothetical protein